MDSAQREGLAREVLSRSHADQTEVLIATSDRALTRFTHQAAHQNVASRETSLSVRAILGGRVGVARSNRYDAAGLDALVERAVDLAKLAPEDPLQGPLPSGRSATAPQRGYDAATANADARTRATMCDAIFRTGEAAECWCAGYVETGTDGITIANTAGALASFDGSNASVNVKMNAADSTGYAEAHTTVLADIDAASVGASAVAKARASRSPRSVEPGAWTVILEPAAFGELLAYLAAHFSAQSFEEGSSFCSAGLDRTYLGENVTIRDDYAHPLAPSMPFDYEGTPTERLALIERGVARNVVTDSYYAAKLHRPNTGHALPAPNAYGPQPLHLVVDGGERSLDELIASTPRGLLVTRFWYIRTVDQKQAIVTGMTRDGTFLIEDGALVGGVRNLRFNQSILDALRHCEFSHEQRRTGGYSYSLVCPSVKVENFAFTSTTEF